MTVAEVTGCGWAMVGSVGTSGTASGWTGCVGAVGGAVCNRCTSTRGTRAAASSGLLASAIRRARSPLSATWLRTVAVSSFTADGQSLSSSGDCTGWVAVRAPAVTDSASSPLASESARSARAITARTHSSSWARAE